MLQAIGFASSTYYYALKHEKDKKEKEEDLVELIRTIQERSNWIHGSRPMVILVKRETGRTYGRRRIARIMKEYHLQARIRRRKHPVGYYQRKREAMRNLPENILNREFGAEKPLQKLVTDITYIPIRTGWCFFCPIMDLYNREIVAYVLYQSIQLELTKQLLHKLGLLELDEHVLLHSDQGATFTAVGYRKNLEEMGITQSMSRPGNCWDNACMESLFGHMKDELGLRKQMTTDWGTYDRVKQMVSFWVEEYNTVRPHSTLHGMSPVEFRLLMADQDENRLQ